MTSIPSLLPAFDPRQVPVTGVDDDLPAVPPERLTPQALRQRFQAPPPWQPEVRREPRFVDRAPVDAAVLVPLVARTGGLSVLLTERSMSLPSHPGQVAFPGGKIEPDDGDVVHAALRETREEVGLAPGFIDVLGQLPVYATGSQFLVTPVVALVREGFVLQPNAGEVAHAFEVPLAFLMNPAHHRRHRFEWAGGSREWFSMPYREPAPTAAGAPAVEHYIWGATAGMLRNLYRFLLA
ncbi:NUDIX hydrolase [Ottowia pentelensis]|uniref:NUDIX hydrolase n=1 Tax=Ottowia pentelensis TaxID=511108 RepID=A0ABV6PX70_9BURK